MNDSNEFRKYAVKHLGMSGLATDQYISMINRNRMKNSYISPTIIEERQMNIAQMDVFSRLQMEKIIFVGTAIDDNVANIITAQLLFLESIDSKKDITMMINSPGGSIYSGYSILDTMEYIKNDISTMVTGLAASMAAILLTSGAKGKRSALKHSRIMIHQPLSGIEHSQATDIKILNDQIQLLKKELSEVISETTGKSIKKVLSDMERDYWMTSEEAKTYGLIDEIVIKRPDDKKS